MREWSKAHGGLVAAVAALSLAVVAVILLVSPPVARTSLEDSGDFFAAEKEYAALHPVYTRCAAKVDLQKFVENIRKTCGDVHELTTVTGPCKAMLLQKSKDFGCCWESVMQGYTALDPQAAHKWRMWQGTVSGKGGVTFDSDDCGESMGEKGYSDLKDQMKSLENVVGEQQSEIGYIMDAFWSAFNGYGSYGTGGSSDPYGDYGSSHPYGDYASSYGNAYDPYIGDFYHNFYDPLTGAYFKRNGKYGTSLHRGGAVGQGGIKRRGAPQPPRGVDRDELTRIAAGGVSMRKYGRRRHVAMRIENNQQRLRKVEGSGLPAPLRPLLQDAKEDSKTHIKALSQQSQDIKRWWQAYAAAAAARANAATARANQAASRHHAAEVAAAEAQADASAAAAEHWQAAQVHKEAANNAIYSAFAHAYNADMYGRGYNDLMDKYDELEGHSSDMVSSTHGAKVAAAFALRAQKDAEHHRDAAKKAADNILKAASLSQSGEPLLPMTETVPPVGTLATFFTINDPDDKAVQKLSANGVNVGYTSHLKDKSAQIRH